MNNSLPLRKNWKKPEIKNISVEGGYFPTSPEASTGLIS